MHRAQLQWSRSDSFYFTFYSHLPLSRSVPFRVRPHCLGIVAHMSPVPRLLFVPHCFHFIRGRNRVRHAFRPTCSIQFRCVRCIFLLQLPLMMLFILCSLFDSYSVRYCRCPCTALSCEPGHAMCHLCGSACVRAHRTVVCPCCHIISPFFASSLYIISLYSSIFIVHRSRSSRPFGSFVRRRSLLCCFVFHHFCINFFPLALL